MAAALLLLPILIALCVALYSRDRNPFHPAFAVIASFAIMVALNLIIAPSLGFYRLRWSGAGGVVLGLTAMMVGVLLAGLVYPPQPTTGGRERWERIDPATALGFAGAMFLLYAFSNLIYWWDVNTTLGLGSVLSQPGRLKAAEVNGQITSPLYFFRASTLVPVALVLAVFKNPGKRLPLLLLLAYLGTAIFQVRRDPILGDYSAAFAAAFILADRPRKLVVPIIGGLSVFLAVSIALMIVLARFNFSLGGALFGYTAGNLSAFQAMVDGFYPEIRQQPMENTFYMFYSLLKYLAPALAPESVIKPNPYQAMLPNTYSFLGDFYLDLGALGLVLGPLLVGLVIGWAHGLARRRPSYITLVFFGVVYATCSTSFITNQWSWYNIPGTVVQGAIMYLLFWVPISEFVTRWRAPAAPAPAGPLPAPMPPS